MSNHDLPRQGSRAAKCVAMLQKLGGTATVEQLRRLVDPEDSLRRFEESVVIRMRIASLASIERDTVTITTTGQRYLGIVPEEKQFVGTPAAPRVGGGFRPLRSRSPMVLRPGSMDFRDIPSVVGDSSIPYKGPTSFAGAKHG